MPDAPVAPKPCTLDEPRVQGVLNRLHREADRQRPAVLRFAVELLIDRLRGRTLSSAEQAARASTLHLPLGRRQGLLAYLLVRALAARRVVEFGTSVGVSTIYLAAAVRDNGGGVVIGTELEPTKVRAARAHVAEAGLADLVEIREGDALETLRDPGGPVDFALLDGWKELYLPVLQCLAPQLRPGALVLADNLFTFWLDLRPYRDWLADPANGFRALTLPVGDGMSCALRL